MPKQWRYYEGTSSANTVLKDLAKVMCTAVKDDPIYDDSNNLVKPSKIIQERNWDVVYPLVNMDVITGIDRTDLSPEDFLAKIEDQLARSTDTIILKTKTTPVDLSLINNSGDDIGLENDLGTRSIDMYVELYKPRYMADPEQNNPEVERYGIKPYNVTKDIYQAYASTKGIREYKLLEDTSVAGDPTQITLTTVTDTAPTPTQTALCSEFNPSSEPGKCKLIRALYAWKTKTLDVTNTANFDPLSVPSMDITKVPDNIITLLGDLYSITPLDYQNFSCSVSKTGHWDSYYGRTDYYYLTLTIVVNRTKQLYKLLPTTYNASRVITGGMHFILPDPVDKIKVSTVKFLIGNNEQPASSYSIDLTSGQFTLNTLIPSSGVGLNANIDGAPTITYEYEKEAATVTGGRLLYNNHYIYIRMFDVIEDDSNNANYMKAPKKNDVDPSTGEIIKLNSHVSEWSKLSWYQDYEEVLKDALDDDVGDSDLSQGVKFLPIETPGLNGDTRIRFWVNTNNDRVIAILMGNPSLDFSANRHLTSVMYLGKIESFENSINDTAGNFALFTSASTNPCATKTVTNRVSQTDSKTVGAGTYTGGNSIGIQDFTLSPPRDKYIDTNASMSIKLVSTDDTTHVTTETILDANLYTIIVSDDKTTAKIHLSTPPANLVQVVVNYSYYSETVQNINGIIRDDFGNILDIRYPDTWGKNTATGVTDVCMLHTRSKAYFQKHHFMFTTTEEYMTKEMYGKSAYTGEYYADRIKITHGNDGPRGMLQDVLVIDQSSLVALDELIVNRDFSKDATKPEETYVFFPVNASFSPFAGSPNAMYGLAMKKDFKLPAPADDTEAVQRCYDDLYIGKLTNVTDDIYLPTDYADGVTITWSSSDATTIATS